MRKSLLPLLWALLLIPGARVIAAPTPAEIAAALDDPSGVWSFEGAAVEVVPFEGAVGGTALRLEVPKESYFAVYRGPVSDRLVGRIRLWVETTEVEVLDIHGDPLPIAEVTASQWTLAPYHQSDYYGAFRYALYSNYHFADETRVVYLDGFEASPGILVDPDSWGSEIEIQPAKAFYDPDEYVTLTASSDAEHDRFLHWLIAGAAARGSSVIATASEANSYRAVSESVVTIGGIEVAVSAASAASEPSPGVLRFESLPSRSNSSLRIRSPGTGFLSFMAAHVETELADPAYTLDSFLLAASPSRIELWASRGEMDIELSFDGALEIWNLEFEPGAPFDISTIGEGAVVGAPVGGRAGVGEKIVLTAEPAPGWEFGGWLGEAESDLPTLELEIDGAISVAARFYERREFLGFQVGALGGDDWIEDLDGSALAAPSPAPDGWEGALVWSLEGPGELSFDYALESGEARLLLDSQEIQELARTSSIRSASVMVPPGLHAVALEVWDISMYGTPDVRFLNVDWRPGYAIDISSGAGGSVVGAPTPGSTIADGQVISLAAIPDPGFSFSHWTDPGRSTGSELTVTARKPMSFQAIFSKTETVDSWVQSQTGAGQWTYEAGSWTSPIGLEPGQRARIEAVFEGPCRLEFDVEGNVSGAELVYGWDGQPRSQIGAGATLVHLPAGAHSFFIEYEQPIGQAATSVSISDFRQLFEVKLTAQFGSIETEPVLSASNAYPYDPKVWSGWMQAGAQLTYEAKPDGLMEFLGWSGDIEGAPASGALTVDAPITATAAFGPTLFEPGDGTAWTIDKPLSTYLTELTMGLGLREPATVALSAELTGPASLTIFKRQLSRFDVEIDGQAAEPLRSNSQTEVLYIPSGSHSVSIEFEATGDVRILSRYTVSHGISYIALQSGYPVVTRPTLGGSISTTREGDTLSATATPAPGSEFVAWDPPFQGKPATFTVALDGPAVLGAIFRTARAVGGFEWTYSGRHPPLHIPPETPGLDPRFTEGYFHFDLQGLQPGAAPTSASTIVQGPGELTAIGMSTVYSELLAELVVDGQSYSPLEAQRGIQIGPGAHTVAWRFSAQGESIAGGFFLAGLPRLQTIFPVESNAWHASVSKNPDKAEYAHGEIVTLTAPETDANGAAFAGWWAASKPDGDSQAPNGIFLSDQNPYAFTVSSKSPLYAAYGKRSSDSADVSLLSTRKNSWNASSEPPSPNGGSTLETGDEWATLVFAAKEDIYLSFDVKRQGRIDVSRSDGTVFYAESGGSLGWTRISVALDKGESISLSGYGPLGMTYIGGIATQAGWGPTLARRADKPIAIEPAGFSDLPPGSAVTLRPTSTSASAFVGWLREDNTLDESESIAVEAGSDTLVQAIFAGPTNTPIGVAEADFPARWTSDSPMGSLSSSHGNLDIPYNELRIPVEGPSVLTAESDGSIDAFIDGSPIDWRAHGQPNSQDGYLQIPEGARELTLRYATGDDTSNILYDLALTPGVAVAPQAVEGGRAVASPEKLVFAPGEVASFVAKPTDGWVFAGWKPPYGGEGARFVRPADAELRPQPIFRPETIEFEALGRAWRGHGVGSVKQLLDSSQSDHARYAERTTLQGGYGLLSWVATEVEGPTMVTVGSYPSLLINGVPADDERFASEQVEGAKIRIGIPAGSELRIPLTSSHTVDLHEDIDFEAGCLLVARGAGLTLSVTPELSRYPVGTEVTIEALDQVDPEDIEWLGLPAGAEIEGRKATFAIADHLRIDALRWEEIRLLGQFFRHAGARDWEQDTTGPASLSGLRNRDADFLALQVPKGAQLRYEFDLHPGGIGSGARLAIFEDGGKVARFPASGYPGASGLLMASEADREFIFRIFKSGFSSSSHSPDAELESLRPIDGPSNNYLSWWIGYDSNALAPDELLLPDADPDGDGLHNYAEYLLGADPLHPDPHLAIRPSDGSYPLELLSRGPSGPAADAFETQFSLAPFGPWEDAGDFLVEIEDAALPSNWRRREIAIDLEAKEPLFFRLKYQSETPSLYDLIDE